MMRTEYYIWFVVLWALVGGCVKDGTSNEPVPKTETNSQQKTESRGSTNSIGLTRPVMVEGQIPGALPELAGGGDSDREKPIVLIIESFGKDNEKCRFSIEEDKAINQAELEELLGEYAENDGKKRSVMISCEGTTLWRHLVEAFNASVKMGFTKISFQTYESSNDEGAENGSEKAPG